MSRYTENKERRFTTPDPPAREAPHPPSPRYPGYNDTALSFDASGTKPHHAGVTISGMKSILFTAFFVCAAVVSTLADIPPPKSQLIVSNLSAFPKVRFIITAEDIRPQLLKENKAYDLRFPVQLYVEDADHKPRIWATVDHRQFTQLVKIRVKEVRSGKKDIDVVCEVEKVPLSSTSQNGSAATTAEIASPFLLAAAGCSGLMLLARRRRIL